jgi:hypothetical protein
VFSLCTSYRSSPEVFVLFMGMLIEIRREDACVREILKMWHRQAALSRKPGKIVAVSTGFQMRNGGGVLSTEFRVGKQ